MNNSPSNQFKSGNPLIDQFMELGENIMASLMDLENMEKFDGYINQLHSRLTEKEMGLIQQILQTKRAQQRLMEKYKKHLKAAGVTIEEEEEN